MAKFYVLKCEQCGKEYELNKNTYNDRKRHNRPNLCHDCMKIYISKQRSIIATEYNKTHVMSEEERKLHSEKIKNGMANMSKESYNLMCKNQSKGQQKRRANMTKEEKQALDDLIRNGIHNMSQEAKENHRINVGLAKREEWTKKSLEEIKNFSDSIKQGLANMSQEAKKQHNINLSIAGKKIYNEKSDEEKLKQIAPLLKYHKNLSKEEEIAYNHLISVGLEKHWENISYNEFIDIMYKMAINQNLKSNSEKLFRLTKTELQFKEILDHYNIEYKVLYYNTKIFPGFRKNFPVNPITGSERISPYHEWDFMILLKNKKIFVDIDGSHHDPKFYKEDSFTINQFNDSQRPYQTDYYSAFVVQCYNDNLDYNSKVVNISYMEDCYTVSNFIDKLLMEK